MRLQSLWPGLLLLAAACVDVNNPPPDALAPSTPATPTPLNLGGIWSHVANTSELSSGTACTTTGFMSLAQTADAISGAYDLITVCTDSLSQTMRVRHTGSVSGLQTGTALHLDTDNGCVLIGTVADTVASFAYGDAFCNFAINVTTSVILQGSWRLTRSSSCGFDVMARPEEIAAMCGP
jgi:hypothetical protein